MDFFQTHPESVFPIDPWPPKASSALAEVLNQADTKSDWQLAVIVM